MNTPSPNKQIIEEAAEWFVEFSTGEADPATKVAFDRWLRKSPEHVRIYLELMPIWDDGGIPLPGDKTTAEELIALARDSENIVKLGRSSQQTRESPSVSATAARRTRLTMRRWSIAASFLLIVLVSASTAFFVSEASPTYGTDLGQHRSVKLPDGSTVELNTQSRIRVKFTEGARVVELLAGQALFNVAKDPGRPFTVRSDATQVRAVGTAFDVYRKPNGTVVTVVEGRVRVDPHPEPDASSIPNAVLQTPTQTAEHPPSERADALLLLAGQQLTLSAGLPPKPRVADVAVATAWTQGRLIFDATPLPEVAEEFNRYNARRIVVDDQALNDFHVNGSFRSSDPASLIRFLKEQPTLVVDESSSEIRITRG